MTIAAVVAIIIILAVMLYEMSIYGRDDLNDKEINSNEYDDAEIQVMDLLHLVETENKEVFAELITYHGEDSNRHLKTHLDLKIGSENEKNDRYFNFIQKMINKCHELKPPTRGADTDFTFVITNSYAMKRGNYDIVRVQMNFCTPDEEECIEKAFVFDFIKGIKEYLLLDIENLELYKE
ncbi:hypothetical protein GWK08_16700 [Leptobacterium flavescens]|uniref:Uncharacterized protein n=1 Tax=Leptobacterium flavescens TaxID=472055 RepID=A0A6P0UXB0_9FLAO|nr:hypothetical protein [Leptobacterium flavescens]NER15096.1 hypothetical protein [Leptobacterium flavescens]